MNLRCVGVKEGGSGTVKEDWIKEIQEDSIEAEEREGEGGRKKHPSLHNYLCFTTSSLYMHMNSGLFFLFCMSSLVIVLCHLFHEAQHLVFTILSCVFSRLCLLTVSNSLWTLNTFSYSYHHLYTHTHTKYLYSVFSLANHVRFLSCPLFPD